MADPQRETVRTNRGTYMYAVVVGQFSSERNDRLAAAVQRGGAEAAFYWDAEDAKAALGDPSRPIPRCIFIDADTVEVGPLVTWLRLQPTLFTVPAVILVDRACETTFRKLHREGVDDSVQIHADDGIIARLAKLAEFDPAERPRPNRGRAVVAHADLARRSVLGRILRIAGFDVGFAENAEDLARLAQDSGEVPALLVVHKSMAANGATDALAQVLAGARGGQDIPAIVLGDADQNSQLVELTELAPNEDRVLFERENAPPDNIAFLANELLLDNVKNQRSSARLLHATMCSFREVGNLKPNYGVTYNLSGGGLYVRTLDTPAQGARLWIELAPPGATQAVHLRGEVMWGQKMSNRRASPPGFGLQFDTTSCPGGDLAAYLEAYHDLVH